MKPRVAKLVKVAAGWAAWEAAWWAHSRWERGARWREARALADVSGKELLVIGAPMGMYPCGDTTVDLKDPSAFCPVGGVEASVENLPFEDKQFGAVYCVPALSHAGAQVTTTKGAQRADKVHVGDVLLTLDSVTGRLVETTVQERFVRRTGSYLNIHFAETSRPLPVTAEHPVRTTRGWVKAKDLRPGDVVHHVTRGERTAHVRELASGDSWRAALSHRARERDPSNGGMSGPERFAAGLIDTHGLPLHFVGNGKLWIGDRQSTAAEIRRFVSNGLTVERIQEVQPKNGVDVYNYRCAPHDSYLVGGVQVHNCSHVLEHVCHPEVALAELHRVADHVVVSYPRAWRAITWFSPGHTWVMWPAKDPETPWHFLRIRANCNRPGFLGMGKRAGPTLHT